MFSYMSGTKRIIAALLVLIMGSVAGCGASSAESSVDIAELTGAYQTEGQSVSKVDYVAPVQIPNILVDQTGFEQESEKVAIFRGKDLPRTFQIRNLKTGEVAFIGDVVKAVLDKESGKYYGIGRFNSFKEPGTYVIYAEHLGESFSFSIGEDIYKDVLDRACQKYYTNRCGIAISQIVSGDNGHSACHTTKARLQENTDTLIDVTGGWHMDEHADRDALIGAKVVEELLLAYEMNPEAFSDEAGIPESGNNIPDIIDEIRYEVDWLLKMQDAKTGGVYGAAITKSQGNGDNFSAPVEVTSVSMDATIRFAATMARFSFIYQQYDQDYATTALRAADRAYESFLINQTVADNTAAFNAAAQLYRATGSDKYRKALDVFFAKEGFIEQFDTDENVFVGAVTYLSTNQEVDKEQCNKLIKALMKKSERIAASATENRFLVADEAENGNFDSLLEDIKCLSITNHIIHNHEYTTIIENHVHYLMGMNPWCINLLTNETERTFEDSADFGGIMNDPHSDALVVFMLSALEG